MKNKTSFISLLSLIAMLLLVLSSLTAILLDDGGDPYSFTTPRGEPIEMYGGNGPYQFDNTYKAITFRSFDWANLFVVFPIFVAGLILFRRNKFRGQLLLAALFTYNFCGLKHLFAFVPFFVWPGRPVGYGDHLWYYHCGIRFFYRNFQTSKIYIT